MNLLIIAIACLFNASSLVAQIPRFTFVGSPHELTQWASLSLCNDGTLVISDGDGNAHELSTETDAFIRIPGFVPINHQQYAERWYHAKGQWLYVSTYTMSISDSTGLVEIIRLDYPRYSSFMWNDSVFIRKTLSSKDSELQTAVWTPGQTTLEYDTIHNRRFAAVHAEEQLSDGTIWLGGQENTWWFTKTGQPDDADSGVLTNSNRFCTHPLQPVLLNELGDSLVVLMRDNAEGKCYVVLSLPMSNLRTHKVAGVTLPEGFDRDIVRGHDQYGVGILPLGRYRSPKEPDQIYILGPDMQTYSVQPFHGIDEIAVLKLVYDSTQRVYYAITTRGLYRSDPVVTSVEEDVHQRPASDVQRPASEITHQTSWYTTLGQRIEPPTTPGLYLKIEIDDKGRMVTEKIVIR
ncbi:MAG: hypothetical protein EHM43_06575 [Ignavibacteriae bacterium]|nr:MAG: hypothetical protein EHM43_06575 [Ignavibacteriota bacterium]